MRSSSSTRSTGLHGQARLFAHFAHQPVGERLAQLQRSTRQRPMALERWVASAHQQYAAPVHHYGANRHSRRLRKLTLHSLPRSARAWPSSLFGQSTHSIVPPIAQQSPPNPTIRRVVNRARRDFFPRAIIEHKEGFMAEFTLRIDNMHCGSCVRRVTQALGSLEGVEVKEVRIGRCSIGHFARLAPGRSSRWPHWPRPATPPDWKNR
jgi:hypothetical protein